MQAFAMPFIKNTYRRVQLKRLSGHYKWPKENEGIKCESHMGVKLQTSPSGSALHPGLRTSSSASAEHCLHPGQKVGFTMLRIFFQAFTFPLFHFIGIWRKLVLFKIHLMISC